MPLWDNFIGGANSSRSSHLDTEATINFYAASSESKSNTKDKVLWPTPGLRSLVTVDTLACRGLWSADGNLFAVVGNALYEIDQTTFTAASLGTIADDGQPVSFACNGRGGEQLLIVGGGEVKVLDLNTNTLSAAITVPLTNAPVNCAFLDGYFLLSEYGTVRVWFSALEDGTSWDALDFYARSQTYDNIVAIAALRDRVWVFGSLTTEVVFDSGDADVPFVPYPGAILSAGLVAPWAWATDGDALYWLSQNAAGRASMVRASEAQPQTISTEAIEFQIGQYDTLTDAEALCYSDEGHCFVVWTFPTALGCGITFAFDTKTSLWAQRGSYDSITQTIYRWRVRGICSTPQGLICGDFETGNIYELDLNTYTDNGTPIKRLRRAPYLSDEAGWLFLDQLEVACKTGIGLASGDGSDPVFSLRLSRDAGRTWVDAGTARMGAQGEYGTRVVFRRLGRCRADQLVAELSTVEPVPAIIGPGVWLRLAQGTGAL